MPGAEPWQILSGLPAWQLTQLPRRTGDGVVQRSQELVSAYCRAAPVGIAWVRDRAGGPVRVITAGPGLAAAGASGQDVLALPAGARGRPIAAGEATSLVAALPCWTELAAVTDVLLADQRSFTGQNGAPPSLEDGLLSAWLGPFGWLLLAEPVDAATLEKLTTEVARTELDAKGYDSPRARLAEQRASARYAELRQAASTGLWRVHLLAGAPTAQQASQVAGLLRASADLSGLPYGLVPVREPVAAPPRGAPLRDGRASMIDEPSLRWAVAAERQRATAVNSWDAAPPAAPTSGEERWPSPQPSAPFYASTALVAALARLPVREVPGLQMVLRPDFDLTPEAPGPADGVVVRLGEILDSNRVPCGDLTIPGTSLNRHVFVCGATGAGKSQTIRGLLEQATSSGIPWLVIEPAKAEYRLMAARLPGAQVIQIRPGDLTRPPAGINPLEPAAGPDGARFPLQTHADLLRALFLAAFQADEPFPQVLSAALTRCYEQAGWDLVTGQAATPGVQPSYPTLEDLQATALTVVDEIGYGREVRDNVRGFVTVRIGSLRLGTTGRFLDGGHPLDFARLLNSNVVFEIEDAGDDRDKAFLMGAVLIRLTEHLRLRQRLEGTGSPQLRHLTVVEEAHRLLRQPPVGTGTGPAAQAVEMFADLLAEVRAYGEGLIIAEQIPSKLIPDAIKNTAVKIVHRLPAADDRAVVGATMNLTEDQSRYLVTLIPGEAAVFTDGMDYALLTRMPDGTAREVETSAGAVSPEVVTGRRSLTCGRDCLEAPCTLAQMRAAQRAAADDSRLTLWAELSVLGHLTGWTMPRPGAAFLRDLRAMPARLRDCALAHAVDQAVASRGPVIASRISAEVLAVHVVAAIRQMTADGTWLCEKEEPEYLAPQFRWALVRDALTLAYRKNTVTGRHSRTAEWERLYGRTISGDTCARQLGEVQRWYDTDQRDPAAMSALAWGTRPRTAIEQAVGARASDEDWNQHLTDALSAFTRLRWPRNYLRTPGRTLAGSGK